MSGPTGVGTARFARLTYTSFDRGDGSRGGWQVKDRLGGLSIAEEEFLVSRVSTRIEETSGSANTGRLMHAPACGGSAWWHTVPAGADATRRPGNVFADVLLDRCPDLPVPRLRSSDLIRSPEWLRPHGPEHVLAATLVGRREPPWSPAALDRAATVSFLAEVQRERPRVLAAVLDAVAAALAGGPTVVLGVQRPEHGDLWVAGICQLMSPGTSRRFFWSTAEHVDGLEELSADGVHLAIVPLDEVASVDLRRPVLVIAEDADSVELGLLDATPHTVLRTGASITVTPWSVIASVVLESDDLAHSVLEQQDLIAEQVGDHLLAPEWPMALAVVQLPDALADAQPEAHQALCGPPPAGLWKAPHVLRIMEERTGFSLRRFTENALEAVTKAGDQEPLRTDLLRTYLARAIEDHAWLQRPETVPLPVVSTPVADAEIEVRALAAVHAALRPAESGVTPLEAVRLVDLLVRAGLLGAFELPGPVATQLCDRVVELVGKLVPVLLADHHGELVCSVGRVAEATRRRFLLPAIDDALEESIEQPGERVPHLVMEWLYPEPPAKPDLRKLIDGVLRATEVEFAVHATRLVTDSPDFRLLALCARLQGDDDHAAVVARFATGSIWPADELTAALDWADPVMLAPLLRPAILSLPDGGGLPNLLDEVRSGTSSWADGDSAASALHAMAELRQLACTWWERQDDDRITSRTVRLLDLAETQLSAADWTEMCDDLRESVIAAYVADSLLREGTRPPREVIAHRVDETGLKRDALPWGVPLKLGLAVQSGALSRVDVVLGAQMCAWAAAEGETKRPSFVDPLRLLAEQVEIPLAPVLDQVARQMLRGRYRSGPEARAALATKLWEDARAAYAARGGARSQAEYEEHARSWWAALGYEVSGPDRVARAKGRQGAVP